MTKYLFFLGLIIPLLFNACSYGSEVPKSVLISGYDFTKYTEKGFLFTPEQYLEDYDAIGLLNLEVIPEVRKVPYGTRASEHGWEIIVGTTRYWQVEEISSGEVLDSLYKKAVSMGADAVVRFNLEAIPHNNGDVNYYGLQASGFAIKRKGALK